MSKSPHCTTHGGGRCSWLNMCTVWPSHSKWLSKQSKESASNFVCLNIPLQKLFRWFRRPQLWANGDWELQQDNTPFHASPLCAEFLEKHQITQGTQAPYSTDLAPCDFWLFPKLKSLLKRKRFQTVNEIQENTMGQLMVIRTVWGPKVPTLKVSEPSLSYVHCNVSCLLYLLQ